MKLQVFKKAEVIGMRVLVEVQERLLVLLIKEERLHRISVHLPGIQEEMNNLPILLHLLPHQKPK
jgi:hypothetical protein